ncbi:MAG: DUF6152 family protein [Pseudomonadales bacterium]|nr:DUF6152 family protein [Pseudomonadales bacterium]
MKNLFRLLKLTIFCAGLLGVTAVHAHHSFTQFDRDTELVKTGKVVRWAFNNPHSWLYLNIGNEDGSETLWSFEGSSPTSLVVRGITGATFEPGDTVTFMYCPLRDGRPGGAIGWVRLDDGSYVSPSDGGCNGNAQNIERWKGWLEQGFTSSRDAD